MCTEGPRLESPAEIKKFRIIGADLVGMTLAPETFLARELEMCYAPVCYLTNYAEGVVDREFKTGQLFEGMQTDQEKSAVEQFCSAVSRPPRRQPGRVERSRPCLSLQGGPATLPEQGDDQWRLENLGQLALKFFRERPVRRKTVVVDQRAVDEPLVDRIRRLGLAHENPRMKMRPIHRPPRISPRAARSAPSNGKNETPQPNSAPCSPSRLCARATRSG